MMRSTLFLCAALLSIAGPAFAEQDAPPPGKVRPPPTSAQASEEFDAADTNGNGLLEKSEWLNVLPASVKPHADLVWKEFEPTGGSAISKQRFIEVRTSRY